MRRREREGRAIPADYLAKPELPADLTFIWDAFWRLDTERPLGMGGQGSIPYSSVLAYAGRLAMSADEADWFSDLIAAMDEAWFLHQRERREADARIEKEENDAAAGSRAPGRRRP